MPLKFEKHGDFKVSSLFRKYSWMYFAYSWVELINSDESIVELSSQKRTQTASLCTAWADGAAGADRDCGFIGSGWYVGLEAEYGATRCSCGSAIDLFFRALIVSKFGIKLPSLDCGFVFEWKKRASDKTNTRLLICLRFDELLLAGVASRWRWSGKDDEKEHGKHYGERNETESARSANDKQDTFWFSSEFKKNYRIPDGIVGQHTPGAHRLDPEKNDESSHVITGLPELQQFSPCHIRDHFSLRMEHIWKGHW